MSLSRSRTITLVVAIATLTSNTLSTVLFHQLPDDPYKLASNFSWYLHFANVLSIFGFIGALRQHALSVTIFSNYLILDTILCAIPRFLVLSLLSPLSSQICAPSSASTTSPYSSVFLPPITPSSLAPTNPENAASVIEQLWSEDGCMKILVLAQWTLAAGVLAATILQFVGAMCVREYGRALGRREEANWLEEEMEFSCDGMQVEDDEDQVVLVAGENLRAAGEKALI
jgi:hypothetical protein